MHDISLPPVKHKLRRNNSASHYPTRRAAYRQKGYEFLYADRLVHLPSQDFYTLQVQAFVQGLGDGRRMSTAAEELAIQLELERAGEDPRTAKVFDDLFARNNDKRYFWQWTATGLRVPPGRQPNAYEVDKQGRKYWVRILLIGNAEIGEVLVPEGNGRVVPHTSDVRDVWDELSGLPTVTEMLRWPHHPYTTHFWFDPNLEEVAVGRGARGHSEAGECLDVLADCPRLGAAEYTAFRLVQGVLPKIQVKVSRPWKLAGLEHLWNWLPRT